MDLSVAPTTEYSRIVNIAPSMSGEAANGPGLGETKETLRGFSDDQYNITFAGAIIAVIPLVILLLFFQRHLVRGLTSGAVKG